MLLKARKAIRSKSRTENPYDNALMKLSYQTIKRDSLIIRKTIKNYCYIRDISCIAMIKEHKLM